MVKDFMNSRSVGGVVGILVVKREVMVKVGVVVGIGFCTFLVMVKVGVITPATSLSNSTSPAWPRLVSSSSIKLFCSSFTFCHQQWGDQWFVTPPPPIGHATTLTSPFFQIWKINKSKNRGVKDKKQINLIIGGWYLLCLYFFQWWRWEEEK